MSSNTRDKSVLHLVRSIHCSRNYGFGKPSAKTNEILRMSENKDIFKTKLEFKCHFQEFMRPRKSGFQNP